MLRTRKRLWFCCSLLCINLAFIWGNSLLPGEISGAISGWLRDLLASLFPGGPDKPDSGHGLLRKLAHFTEFCTLGMLISWLCAMLLKKGWQRTAIPLLCGIFAACVDETIQCFVPGRGPGIKDVGIDTLGVTLGVVIIYFIRKRKKLKYLEEQTL